MTKDEPGSTCSSNTACGVGTLKDCQLEKLVEDQTRTAEALQQLREDCRESIQKEVRSRLQDQAKLRQDLEMERKTRKEAFGMVQKAMTHCGTA
mmetsp:Transcript_62024/g.111249  ORF Transcript_62024/g.111249 Transcript_62024/m.111249 type:complete len:94 (+) Transcript_62024:3-284(+)